MVNANNISDRIRVDNIMGTKYRSQAMTDKKEGMTLREKAKQGEQ